ncbi:MAG: response regulator transcription factor [Candidatus Competibacteraceae bacterium]|nr:response regulator transcription factor [Candidatus Competibacteraceae bacterium]MBK8962671.1 response regulator transcription factor [Candidatus Competibacteraceae bacterium]
MMATSGAGAPDSCLLRLLIVDDQPLIRRGLGMMLAAEPDIEVVGQAADGLEAIEKALATQPDIVVMDLQMPRASGIVATREITAKLPATRVVVLTTYDYDDLVFEAICAGAQAYLLKDASEAEVLETLWAVRRGESRLSPTIARKVMDQFRSFAGQPAKTGAAPANGAGFSKAASVTPPSQAAPLTAPASKATVAPSGTTPPAEVDPLTDKEERILDLLAEGKSNKQIAAEIFLAEGTVKNYVSRIMDKLHARSRTELALHATKRRG